MIHIDVYRIRGHWPMRWQAEYDGAPRAYRGLTRNHAHRRALKAACG